jgi:uncharacterized protein
MSRRFLRRYLPPPHLFKEHKHLQYLGEQLSAPSLWRLNRRSVAGAVSIGLFIAFLPMPGQMAVAAVAAAWMRVNLPVAVAMVWITNPLTMGPIFFFSYKVGTWLLGSPVHELRFELTWHWLHTKLVTIWRPLMLGCLVIGSVAGLSGGLLTLSLWHIEVRRRWRERKRRRMIPQTGR